MAAAVGGGSDLVATQRLTLSLGRVLRRFSGRPVSRVRLAPLLPILLRLGAFLARVAIFRRATTAVALPVVILGLFLGASSQVFSRWPEEHRPEQSPEQGT